MPPPAGPDGNLYSTMYAASQVCVCVWNGTGDWHSWLVLQRYTNRCRQHTLSVHAV